MTFLHSEVEANDTLLLLAVLVMMRDSKLAMKVYQKPNLLIEAIISISSPTTHIM
jgi:hypothetical protein